MSRLRNIPGAKEAVESSEWVIHDPKAQRGSWKNIFSDSSKPLHIEIGMGKGRFIMDMATLHPEINYIGIERYDSVLLRALQKMEERRVNGEELTNVRFLCIDAAEIADYFEMGEVDRIYLNFSDPWPKDRHAKRRLPSKEFLARYNEFLKVDGTIEFKTDNQLLFDFAVEQTAEAGWNILAMTRDLHNDPSMNEGNVMTEYEEKFSAKGNPIYKYIINR